MFTTRVTWKVKLGGEGNKSFHLPQWTIEPVTMLSIVGSQNGLKADFLSSYKLLAIIPVQKKSIMQVLAANTVMTISIVKIVCDCLLS